MKLHRPYTVKEIAAIINCTFVGDPEHLVTGINEIHMVEKGDIVFVDHPKYYDKALNSAATTILIDKEVVCPEGKALLVSSAPFDDYNKLNYHFSPFVPQDQPVGNNTQIDPSALIYPNVFIGHNCTIGAGAVLHSGVSIQDNTTIGKNVIVGANSVIGHTAFYYKMKPEGRVRMHSVGGVILEDDVEIGALCTIDKGVSANTTIGKGTKIDNQVHIGHDTVVGKNCLFAANVGIAGCVVVEDDVIMWGQVGCASGVTIGKGAVIYAQSGISKSLKGGISYFGSPCIEAKEKFKELALIRQLANK